MISADDIEAIRTCSFNRHLVTITLTQDVATDPIIFSGSGNITQTNDGTLHFDCVSDSVVNTDPMLWFNSSFSTRPGQIYPPDKYFRFVAEDHCGREWTALPVLINCQWPAQGTPTIDGKLSRLETNSSKATDRKHYCELYFFDDLDLPSWPKHAPARFQTEFAMLEICAPKNEPITVIAKSDTKLPLSFPLRIEEALRFLTATETSAQIVSFSNADIATTYIYAKQAAIQAKNFVKPLTGPHLEVLEESWSLFRHYLDYVAKTPSPDHWNRVTYHLHNARAGSGASMDAWALSVSVAVEGLSHLLDASIDPEKKALVGKLREWLNPLVEVHPQFASLAERLNGLLGMMLDIRVKDRLQPLADGEFITSDYLKVWGGLRNKFVHPKGSDLLMPTDTELQLLLDVLYKVTTLMYEIVFYIIGYQGPYTDYGAIGWPVRPKREWD